MASSNNKENSTENKEFKLGEVELSKKRYQTEEFDSHFLKFYLENPFMGPLCLGVKKLADESVATAYMSAAMTEDGNDFEFVLGFNPNWLRAMPQNQILGVLKHEMYHLLFQHVTSRGVFDSDYAMLWNVATDLCINSLIGEKNLPSGLLIPGKRPMMPDKNGKMVDAGPAYICDFIEKAPPGQASDFYFEGLKKVINDNPSDNKGEGEGSGGGGRGILGEISTMDDHDRWGDLPPEIEEIMKEKVRDALEEAIRRADNDPQKNMWGDMPIAIQEHLRKMISREIDWRSIVRQFVGRCRSIERIGTVRRINKRAPYIFPGSKRKTRAKFRCFIDQSGSMSDLDITMLFAELEGLANETEIEVFHFDTEVDLDSRTVWKKGRPYPPHRTRCGGTDFGCVQNFLNSPGERGKTDGVFILTDGYAPVMGQVFGCRVMWVITESGTLEATRPGDLAVKMKSKDKGKFHRS